MKMQVFSRNFSIYSFLYSIYSYRVFHLPLRERKKPPRFPITETGAVIYFIGAFSSAHAITCGGSWSQPGRVPKLQSVRIYDISLFEEFSAYFYHLLPILAFLGHKRYLQYFHWFNTVPIIPAFKQSLDSDHAAMLVSRYNLLPTECWFQYGKNGFQFEVDLLMSVVLLLCNPTHLCFYMS